MKPQQLAIPFESDKKESENQRAFRISLRMRENHSLLSSIYENLVDRDFDIAGRDIKVVIMDLRLILKSMEDDDF